MFEFGVVALFPELVEPILRTGVLGRAREAGVCGLRCVSPRAYALDRHRSVDDRPYGGGPGMVLRYEPVAAALAELRRHMPPQARCIALSAQGRRFDQQRARESDHRPRVYHHRPAVATPLPSWLRSLH